MKLYYKDEYIRLFQGDCLEVMDKMIEKKMKVDCILADLPYGTTKCKWDSIIDLDKLWDNYKRILKDNGYIILFSQTPFDKKLGSSNIEMLKYEWIWIKDKPTGHLNANYAPMKKHENILVFTNNPTSYTKNNIENGYNINHLLSEKNKEISRTNKHGIYDINKKQTTKQKYTGYPNDILTFSSDKESYHPCQKPIELLEYLIKIYTNEGDLILDNTCGSGSTLVASRNLKRKCIGIELEEKYCEIAKNRLIA